MRKNFYSNNKGFTLIEIMIAVAIFGIISAMTFSIINYVPKLAKEESAQFSERAYVRRVLTEITGTIQNASDVTVPALEFIMPDGETIEYNYSGGNINKIVNGTPQRLMESVDEFSITDINEHLFNIHIKTSKEGINYDFKVDSRRNTKIKSEAVISTISPMTAVFDKNAALQQDIIITMDLKGNEFVDLYNGLEKLNSPADYSVSGNILTLSSDYLKNQLPGTIEIAFHFSRGANPILSVEIIDTSSYIKIQGNALADDVARMNPGNVDIDPMDNSWIITVTNGTLVDDTELDINDLDITGLPGGIIKSAAKGEGNSIEISLSGTASEVVGATKQIDIVVKNSAVTSATALDSDPIQVSLLPVSNPGEPEQNLMFTSSLKITSAATITGDIVIGRGQTMTIINNDADIDGYVYVDSSLTVNSPFTVGKADKNAKLFVKGSVTIKNDTLINGDLFHGGTLNATSPLTVTGVTERRAVEIPDIEIPDAKDLQWYINNEYTIIDKNWSGKLEDNGKYYFKNDYAFNSNKKLLADNVTIVGMKNITMNAKFSGSGIIFTPNGRILVNNDFTFTGMCVSQITELQGITTLKFQRYADLPF